jgi:phage terminase large subunit
MIIEWCEWYKIINKRFEELRERINTVKPRYVILYGGRGSGKSDYTAKELIFRCLNEKYFRFILVRNTYGTIKDSQYQTIKDIIIDLGLSDAFEFNLQPLEIRCINGNKFLARGCDDTTKFKSIKDPTGVWWEEDIPAESDFITVTTSIRTQKADNLVEFFTINPEVDGDFADHWFYKKFFQSHNELSFEGEIVETVDNREVILPYIVMHSTYKDNKWIPDEFIAFLMNLKHQDPYYYTIYCLGQWGNRITGGNAYKNFDRNKHVAELTYNPELPLHLSFDFNVNPYMTLSIWQMYNESLYCIGEICTPSPKNTTKGICNEFKKRFPNHNTGVMVYGDPSGRSQDTRSEKGFNDYTIIANELIDYRPSVRVASVAPSISGRLLWINSILAGNREVNLCIDDKCVNMINDLMNLKEDQNGAKFKQKVKDPKTGVTYEKLGHLSDSLDYIVCQVFSKDYNAFKTGTNRTPVKLGGSKVVMRY